MFVCHTIAKNYKSNINLALIFINLVTSIVRKKDKQNFNFNSTFDCSRSFNTKRRNSFSLPKMEGLEVYIRSRNGKNLVV